ncbi:hypothetical protein P8452_75278 [Trifolium repens]|nr:hypothetical protein P8452_75278 [Trifolium repens]
MVRVRLLVLGTGGGGAAPVRRRQSMLRSVGGVVFSDDDIHGGVVFSCSFGGGVLSRQGAATCAFGEALWIRDCEVHGIGVESGAVVWLRGGWGDV